ncbi:MAG: response regulator transcription factor [Chelatococcus sp.]|nr:response regulator transcription factor [Chelatococcus sp. HY11]MBX3544070.1 response regulator transcription factor [Chelatococcus sp.]
MRLRLARVHIPSLNHDPAVTSTHSQTVSKNNGNSLFTVRQAAVVGALRQGKANKRIAYELNMQESTVKVHVRNIMRKLKAKNRTEVAVLTHELFLKGDDG